MTTTQKTFVSKFLSALIIINTVLFVALAFAHKLSTEPKAAVFVDFWGRFTVYSMWFIGFTVYVRYLSKTFLPRIIVVSAVCLNIPLFLLLAYCDKISNSPEMLVYIDFWGRITVYSLWVICFELYKSYIAE
jgi:hypothetical protein